MPPAGLGEQDWALLRSAPWAVAVGVMMADPSGLLGRRNELMALLAQVRVTDDDAASSGLVAAVAADVAEGSLDEALDLAGIEDPDGDQTPRLVLERCAQVDRVLTDVVQPTSPGEADAFRRWLLVLAGGVAEATKEGGVLGFGGEAVSEAEHDFLGRLADALGLTGPAADPAS